MTQSVQSIDDVNHLQRLIEHRGHNSVSIAMPTHRSGPETRGDAIAYKNLIDQVHSELVDRGLGGEEAERYLDELLQKKNDSTFWQNQTEGLLALHSDSGTMFVHLRHRPAETVHIGESYYLAPMVMDEVATDTHHVLAITKQRAELWEVRDDQVSSVEHEAFPATFEDLITDRDPEKQLQFHSQGTGGRSVSGVKTPIYHGQGEGESKVEGDYEAYYARVLERLHAALPGGNPNIVVMATEEVSGHLLAHADFTPCKVISGSIDGMTPSQVREKLATELSGESHEPTDVVERFGTALSRQQGSTNLDDVINAANEGRVETLLVRRSLLIDGGDANHPETTTTTSAARRNISTAMGLVQQNSGTVLLFDHGSDSIGDAPVAAIYRY